MAMRAKHSDVDVAFGDGTAVVRRGLSSSVAVANVLGRERDAAGREVVYLDRVVHFPGEKNFAGWAVSGAVSTILREHRDTDTAEDN